MEPQTTPLESAEIRKRFGALIKERRKVLGITQSDLAEALNISCTYLREIERGVHTPTWTTFLRICKVLNVSADKLADDYAIGAFI